MPRAEPEMVLINKFYDFAVWTGNHVAKFPKTHKFTVGDRLQNRVSDILETLIKAKYRRNRLELLQDANLGLELLRFQFRMARDLGCLSPESLGSAARAVNEVGRLVGGWIKSAGKQG